MATFAYIKTFVSKRLQDENNTAISSADVGNAVNAAIAFWKTKEFWFNQFRESGVITAGSTTIPAPATYGIVAPLNKSGLMIEESGNRYEINLVKPEMFDAIYSGNTGRPYIYTWRSGAYDCYFLPNKNYTIYWHYLKDYAALSSDGATNDFTNNADMLIAYEALKMLSEDLLQDTAQSDRWAVKVIRERDNLWERTQKLTDDGRIEVYDF